jgi:hypothetical protein
MHDPSQPAQKYRWATSAESHGKPPGARVPNSMPFSDTKNTGSPARPRRASSLIASAPNASRKLSTKALISSIRPGFAAEFIDWFYTVRMNSSIKLREKP